jgi:hypothetical protein
MSNAGPTPALLPGHPPSRLLACFGQHPVHVFLFGQIDWQGDYLQLRVPGQQAGAAANRRYLRKTSRPGTSSCSKSSAAGGTLSRSSTCARSGTGGRTGSARPRRPVLAGAPPGPDQRERLRADMAGTAPRARQDPRRHLHRPRRHVPAADRDHQTPGRDPQGPANQRPAPHLPAKTRRGGKAPPALRRLDTPRLTSRRRVFARQPQIHGLSHYINCGTQVFGVL